MLVCAACFYAKQNGTENKLPVHLHASRGEGFVVTHYWSDGTTSTGNMYGHELKAERMF